MTIHARSYQTHLEPCIGDVVRLRGDDGAFATCIISDVTGDVFTLTRPHASILRTIAGGHPSVWLTTEVFHVTVSRLLDRCEVYVTGASGSKDSRLADTGGTP